MYFIPFTKVNSKLVTDLNVKGLTIKLLQYKIGENLGDLWCKGGLLDITPKT